MSLLDKIRYEINHELPAFIVYILGIIIFRPIAAFGLGHLSGEILAVVYGDNIINGLNLIFDTTRFSPDILPNVCGTMAVIGSFFCPIPRTNRTIKEKI